MQYLFVLLVLAIVIIPAISVVTRFKTLSSKNIDLEARMKELEKIARKKEEKPQEKSDQEPEDEQEEETEEA